MNGFPKTLIVSSIVLAMFAMNLMATPMLEMRDDDDDDEDDVEADDDDDDDDNEVRVEVTEGDEEDDRHVMVLSELNNINNITLLSHSLCFGRTV